MNPAQRVSAIRAGRDLSALLPPCDVAGRVGRVRAGLRALQADREPGVPPEVAALLVTDLTNVGYLSGFTGSAGRLLLPIDAAERPLLLTDGRYEEQAAHELRAAGVDADLAVGRSAAAQTKLLAAVLKRWHVRALGLEGSAVSWAALDGFRAAFRNVAMVRVDGAVESARRTKDEGELARLVRGSAIADVALATVLPSLGDRPTELEFCRSLEREMERLGASGPSFPTIVAGGPPSSEPHHRTGTRPIERGDAVICDFGATFDGYHSDMTRTVFVGEPGRAARRHFEAVRESQASGVAAVRAGVAGRTVDAACRDALRPYRWTGRFVHGTGHGVGRVIHEAPWLGASSTDELAVDDVVTVEPGVYLPGRGGVRIEDTVVVTSRGSVPITLAPKDLVVA